MMDLKNISLSSHQEIEHFEVTEPIMVLVCFFFFFLILLFWLEFVLSRKNFTAVCLKDYRT